MRITSWQLTALTTVLLTVACADEPLSPEFRSINLQPEANFGIFNKNQLQAVAERTISWDGVPMTFGARGLRLAGTYYANDPARIDNISVDHSFDRLYIVHATKHGGLGHKIPGARDFVEDGTLIGQYQVHYEDGLIEVIPIVYGVDVRDWWNWDLSKPVSRGEEIWRGETPHSQERNIGVRLFRSTWQNPRPDKNVLTLTMISVADTAASPFCVAMTTQQQP